MDTNLISQLLTALVQRQADTPAMPLSAVLWIAAIAPTLAAIAAYITSKAGREESRSGREEIKKVHEAVNSERSAMIQEVKTLRDEILLITKQKAQLEEKQIASERGRPEDMDGALRKALKELISSGEIKPQ